MSRPPSPSGEPQDFASQGLGRHGAAFLILLGALALLRLLAAQAVPLTEDEAYYRLWAQVPAFGYYDHPPMVAWWIWSGIRIAGDSALGVRLLPVMASLITSLLVFDLGQQLGSRRTGLIAALLYNTTLTVGAGAILAIPDVPASLFWVAALWAMARSKAQPAFWLCAGAAAGLACLSKYSALFLAPGVVLWLALTADGRKRLLTPWPWLAAVIAAAIFAANIAWNAEHHWMTFAKQFGRVSPGRFEPRFLGEFIAAQFVLLNPLVAVLAGAGAAKAWKARAGVPLMAAATSLPFLAYLVLHSLHDRVQAHWPVPLYPAAALLAAYAADGAAGWRKRLARAAPLGIALTSIALGYMALPRGVIAKGDPADPLRGWPQFAAQVDGVRAAHGAFWTGTLSYGVNAQLQAQNAVVGPILQINERDRYETLPSAVPNPSRPGLVVDLKRRVDPAKLAACFETVGTPVEIDRGPSGAADARYLAVPVAGMKIDVMKAGCGA
jgi:4-amino-4-deoxy-L-arabinose transferase-like glycosyltransferase